MIESKQLSPSSEYLSFAKGSFVLLFGLAAGMAALPFLPWWEGWTLGQILFLEAVAALFFFRATESYRQLRELQHARQYPIAVDSSGIQSLDPQRYRARLLWSEITAIKALPKIEAIKLYGPVGTKPLRLAYQLEGLSDVLPLLLEHAQRVQRSVSFPITFKKNTWRQTLLNICAAIGVGVASWVFLENESAGVTAFFSTLAGMNVSGFWLPDLTWRLVILDSGFQVHQKFTITAFNFHDVQSITLTPHPPTTSGTIFSLDVKATLSEGQEISLLPPGRDAFAVYAAAKTLWEQHQG